MSAIEFTAQSGKTFSVQLYNATTLTTIGTALTPTGTGGIYRVSTGANTGIVYVEATATNLLVTGFANLDEAAANGYSGLKDTYDEAVGVAAAVLDEALSGHTTAGTVGAALTTASSAITVVPLTGVVESRVSGTTISLFTGETPSVSVACLDAEGNAVTLTGLTLELTIETLAGTDVEVIADADIGKSGSTFTFSPSTTVTATARTLNWSLRKTSDDSVLMHGKMTVSKAAKAD